MGALIESLEFHSINFTFHLPILKFSAWILNLFKNIAEKDLSSKEFPGQFLPAYLREIAENIIA